MKRVIFLVLVLFTFSSGITLDDVIRLSKQRALKIKISQADLKKIQYKIKEVKSNLYPKIVFNGQYSRIDRGLNTGFTLENQYRFTVVLSQKIFDKVVFESIKYANQNIRLQRAIEKDVETKIISTAKEPISLASLAN